MQYILSDGLYEGRPRYRRNTQHFFFVVIFTHHNPDPDPADQNQCGSMRSASTTLFSTHTQTYANSSGILVFVIKMENQVFLCVGISKIIIC
jgi:hypothetical protein